MRYSLLKLDKLIQSLLSTELKLSKVYEKNYIYKITATH